MKIRLTLGGVKVTLPVPEGADPNEYAAAVRKRHSAIPRESAASDNGFLNLAAGVGRSGHNIARQAGNMVGAVSDEDLNAATQRDQDLLNTKAGAVGNFTGELALTAPLAGGLGVGAGALVKTLSKAPRAASWAARQLAKPVGAALVTDAGTGAVLAGPNQRGQGAALGAGFSLGGSAVGAGLKRTFMKPWVKKTDEALRTEARTGHSIPLSQSAEDGVWKSAYEGYIANVPGVGAKYRKQYDVALTDFREWVSEKAAPFEMFQPKGDEQQIMKDLGKVWDNKYASFTFKGAPIRLKTDLYSPPEYLKKNMPDQAKLPEPGSLISGQEVLDLSRDVQSVIDGLDENMQRRTMDQLTGFKRSLDKVLHKNLDPTGKGKGVWAGEVREYMALRPYYAKYVDLLGAARKAPIDGKYSPGQLAAVSNRNARPKRLVAGEGHYGQEAKDAHVALQNFPSEQGIFQTRAALGALTVAGGWGGGPVGAALGLGVPVAAAKVLASPKVQRAMAGQLPGQHALAAALRRRKGAIAVGTGAARRAAVIGATSE